MNSTLSKVLSGMLALLMAICIFLTLIFYFKNSGIDSDASWQVQIEKLGSALEYFIVWAYVLIFLTAALTIVFPMLQMATNPKSAVKTIIGFVGIAIVIGISYSLADDTVLNISHEHNVAKSLKLSGTGLITTYILFIGSIVSLIYSEIVGLFK